MHSVKRVLKGICLTAAFAEVSERCYANKSAHGPALAHDFVRKGAHHDASSGIYFDPTLYFHVLSICDSMCADPLIRALTYNQSLQ